MKLILANNQSSKFTDFYSNLAQQSPEPFVYDAYAAILFCFDTCAPKPATAWLTSTNQSLEDFDGVYINGYLNTYELAVTTAATLDALDIPYVNSELRDAPSLSKLSAYAKLAANGVSIPKTYAGAKRALLAGIEQYVDIQFPAILKRADADRGIDNYKVRSKEQVCELLANHEDRSLWVLQDFIENDGFYLVSVYDRKPAFAIFRSLEERPDHNELKAHMFKPQGGANARLIDVADAPQTLIDVSVKAAAVMHREVGSVDSIYDAATDSVYVLEVNYNPQLVTISTFKEVRQQVFLDNLTNIKKH